MVRKGIKERKLWSETPLPGGQINTTRIARFINRAYNILILPAPAKLVKGRVRHRSAPDAGFEGCKLRSRETPRPRIPKMSLPKSNAGASGNRPAGFGGSDPSGFEHVLRLAEAQSGTFGTKKLRFN